MTAPMKTLLVGAALALAVALFTLQAAHAGGRHHRIPFVTFNPYAADTYEEEVEYYRTKRGTRYESEIDEAVSSARSVAREYLDGDLGGVLDLIDE